MKKLYLVETIYGERQIVFRDGDVIKSNSQERNREKTGLVRVLLVNEIAKFEEFLN